MKNAVLLVALPLSLTMLACGDDDPTAEREPPPADCAAPAELPARIDADLDVGPGCVVLNQTRVEDQATLTIAAGTTILVRPGGYLRTSPFDDGGTLVAKGTSDEPIVFTSQQSRPLAGDWGCIFLGSGGEATELEHVVVEYAGSPCGANGAGLEAAVVISDPQRSIANVSVRDSAGHGVMLLRDAAVRVFENNRFADNELPSIQVNQNQIVSIGPGQVFDDVDDSIEIETTFSSAREGTWTRQEVPWRVVGQMQIGSDDNTVTIEPGTVIELDGASIEVFMANLIAEGTDAEPIVFRSAREAPAPGDWGCVFFNAGIGVPRIRNAIFEHAGSGAGCTGADYKTALIVPDTASVTGNVFRDIDGYAIRTTGECPASFCDNTFSGLAQDEELLCTFSDTPQECL